MNTSFQKPNLTMLTDFYELTMANGYFANGILQDTICYFDMFFRKVPDNGGFAIMAGVEQLVEYLKNLSFSEEDIQFLHSKHIFSREFRKIAEFRFPATFGQGFPEGTPIFPGEPIVTVRGMVIQAQFIETMVLLCINHQSLIATKTNRIVRAAQGRAVMEFGSRRAQGFDGAMLGRRRRISAAVRVPPAPSATSTTACRLWELMAHSWVQLFPTEYEAFKAYAQEYPANCVLLVDTYNVLKSGVPNAIKVFNEVLVPQGFRPAGIRIDSGDITYLSRKARRMLDDAGFEDCPICASNSLDEYIIRDMLMQGAKVDSFGVGERLITSSSEPVFGGVYKLAAVEDQKGNLIPKIKISENVSKITTPCFKSVWRLFDKETDKAIADVITLHDEVIDEEKPYVLFDPEHTWKRKTVENFAAMPLLQPIFKGGECVYTPRALKAIKAYCLAQVDTLWEEVTRFENPHNYYVDLSQRLWDEKNRMLSERAT